MSQRLNKTTWRGAELSLAHFLLLTFLAVIAARSAFEPRAPN